MKAVELPDFLIEVRFFNAILLQIAHCVRIEKKNAKEIERCIWRER